MVYEGACSITGPYLATLGASATVVGIAAGAGEFIGYGLRVVGMTDAGPKAGMTDAGPKADANLKGLVEPTC